MALKKSQLYSSLWQSCDELRGGMDASQYKDYVLTLLFMKYVSDKYAGSPDALIEVPAGGGFADMVKLKGDNCRMVPVAEIAGPANEYNLNIPRYVDSSEPEDQHDLGAHLNGGIPDRDLDALDSYWTVFPSLRPALFEGNGRAGYSAARVDPPQVKATIIRSAEFKSYQQQVAAIFDAWRNTHEQLPWALRSTRSPKQSSVPCPRTCWRASPTCHCSTGTTSTSG